MSEPIVIKAGDKIGDAVVVPFEVGDEPYTKIWLERYRCPACGWECELGAGNNVTAFDDVRNVVECSGRFCVPCLIRWLRSQNALTIMESVRRKD